MSYRCQSCGKASQAYEKCNIVVTKTRKVEYPFRNKVNKVTRVVNGIKEWEYVPDFGGEGTEIVQEKKLCNECAVFSPEIAELGDPSLANQLISESRENSR